MGCVYKITSPSGGVYIGMTTKTLEWRINQHRFAANTNKNQSIIVNVFRKYKQDLIIKSLFESEDEELLYLVEYELIATAKKAGNCYNIANGGKGSSGYKMTEEHKRLQSERTKSFWKNSNYRESQSKRFKSYWSDETKRQNMIKNITGSNNKNSKLTEEQVSKIKTLLSLGVTQKEIAFSFDCKQSNISAIKNGLTWRHVS